MWLSYRIPLITAVILALTAFVNIVSFQYFSERYIGSYIEEISTGSISPNPEQLRAFIKLGTLDKKTQEEYASIIAELSNLSTAIENISKNPELYMSNASGSSDSMFSIPFSSDKKSFALLNIRAFGDDSAEGRFVTNILKWLFLVNIIWLSIIFLLYFFWIRSIFFPIEVITENLRNIIDRKRYANIRYAPNNEFSPLITTINSLHKSLSIQEKIRSDFLSDLSHEIRTPITAVKCYFEAIEDGMMKLDQKTITMLQAELNRLIEITGKIMEYESFTHDIFESVRVERFSIRRATEHLIQEYTPQLRKIGQSIVVQFPSDCIILMDKSMYSQILHNIFSNFIKYAGTDAILTYSFEKTDGEYIFTFSDNGIGIPDEELEFVKEKFYRVDKSRNQEDQSMGIGLSVIDRIAKIHRGSLSIEKNTPNGVKIIVTIAR